MTLPLPREAPPAVLRREAPSVPWSAPFPLATVDGANQVTTYNEAFAAAFSPGQAPRSRPLLSLLPELGDDVLVRVGHGEQPLVVEVWRTDAEGRRTCWQVRAWLERGVGLGLAAGDVTAARRALELTAQAAERDPLTGLANRSALGRALRPADGASAGEALALVLLDLDGFKQVNDDWGHVVGDAVLQAVTRRWSRVLGDEVLLLRLGGDEFGALLPEADVERAGRAAAAVARRLHDALADPVVVDGGHSWSGSVTVATAVAGPDDDLRHLVARADDRLVASKRTRRGDGGASARADRSGHAQEEVDHLHPLDVVIDLDAPRAGVSPPATAPARPARPAARPHPAVARAPAAD